MHPIPPSPPHQTVYFLFTKKRDTKRRTMWEAGESLMDSAAGAAAAERLSAMVR